MSSLQSLFVPRAQRGGQNWCDAHLRPTQVSREARMAWVNSPTVALSHAEAETAPVDGLDVGGCQVPSFRSRTALFGTYNLIL